MTDSENALLGDLSAGGLYADPVRTALSAEEQRLTDSETFTWLQAVLLIAKAASEDEPLSKVFHLVAQTAARLSNTVASAVQLATVDGACLRIEGQVGLSGEYVQRANEDKMISLEEGSPYFHSPSSQAYRSGSIVVIDDALDDNEYMPWWRIASDALHGGGGYRSLAAVPMIAEGATAGVLAVYSREVGVATPRTLALLRILAEHTALALTLARVRSRERKGLQRLTDAYASLQRQQSVLDKVDDLHDGLMRAVIQEGDLAKIASTTSQVLNLDIVLEDALGTLMTSAPTDVRVDADSPWRTSPAGVEAIRRAAELGSIAHIPPSGDEERGAWIIPLVLSDQIVAWVWAFGEASSSDSLQRKLLERAAMAITVELWRERSAREIEWRLSGDLLEYLLRDNEVRAEEVLSRARHLGYDLGVPHTLVLVAVKGEDAGVKADESARRNLLLGLESVLRRRQVVALQTWRDRLAVLLLPSQDRSAGGDCEALVKLVADDLARHLPGRELVLVLSESVTDLPTYGEAYRAALGVVALARSFPTTGSSRVVRSSGLGVYSVLLGASRTRDLLQLRHATLQGIEEYDGAKGGALLATLRQYLATGCKIQPTAAALYMHPNTVMYRLKTVERITGLDLHKPHDLLQAQLAMMIDELTRGVT